MDQRGRPTRGTRLREDFASAVVATLRQARCDAGITRRKLSELSGVSGHTIAKIEQAVVTDPGFSVVAAIASALDLPLDDLVRRASGAHHVSGRVASEVANSPARIDG